jgi:hypothetical protein
MIIATNTVLSIVIATPMASVVVVLDVVVVVVPFAARSAT